MLLGWLGVIVSFGAMIADGYWHATTGITLAEELAQGGFAAIPPFHWLAILGSVITMMGTLQLWRGQSKVNRLLIIAMAIAGVVQCLGKLIDNFAFHIRGIETGPDIEIVHNMFYYGMNSLIILLIAASINLLIVKILERRKGAAA